MKLSLTNLIVVSILVGCLTGNALGQGAATGTISGRITDPSDAPIPGAEITAVNLGTGAEYKVGTTSTGLYTIRFVQPGTYRVQAVQQGFQKAIQPTVVLTAASNPTVNFKMNLGAVAESVTITQEVSLVEFESADRGGEIDRTRTQYTPTAGRVLSSILPSVPGVTVSANDRGLAVYGNSQATAFTINGGQDRSNEMVIDGVPNRTSREGGNFGVVISQEAVSEVKVITNAYSSEYGFTTGGVINVTTRSGTNEYHGEAFTYQKHTGLNANQFERNLAGQPRTKDIGRAYGGVITGPILKNKLFGAFKIHVISNDNVKSFIGRVPTAKERAGNFTETFFLSQGQPKQILIYDPWTTSLDSLTGRFSRQLAPGNVIPASRISPVAKNLWNYIPQPNADPGLIIKASNYIPEGTTRPQDFFDYMPRIDWNVSEKTKLMFRYIRNNLDQYELRFYPTAADISAGYPFIRSNTNLAVDYTKTLSPTSVLNLRMGMERYNTASLETSRLGVTPTDLGFSRTFISQSEAAFPVFQFGGGMFGGDQFSGAGVPAGNFSPDQVNNLDGTWSKIAGRQIFKFGGQLRLERIYDIRGGYTAGRFSFGRDATTGPDPQVATSSAGDEVASFLFGVGSGNIDFNAAPARQMFNQSLFVQDDIKLTPKLTVNLGLRWDHMGPLTDRFNAMTGVFDPNVPSPLASQVKNAPGASGCAACANLRGGLTFPGVNGQPRNVYDATWRDFSPRIALAYALNSKTAVRTGWGIFYGPIYYDPGSTGFSQSTPWITYDRNNLPLNLVDNPFPNGLIPPVGAGNGPATNIGAGVSYISPHARPPRSRQFSFELQREVPWGIRLSAAYVSNMVTRLPVNRSLNSLTEEQFVQGAAVLNRRVTNPFAGLVRGFSLDQATVSASTLIVPFPQFPSVTELYAPIGSSRYDGLQMYAVKRLSHGFSFSVAYTVSKKLVQDSYQYPTDTKLEKLFDLYDFPQVLVPNFVFELPFGHNRWLASNAPGWMDRVIGGWQVSALLRFQKGKMIRMPANAIPTAADPNAAPGGQSINQWINPAAFITNTDPFRVRRWPIEVSDLRSPPIHRADLQITKKTRITERFMFEAILVATNATNTAEFYDSPAGTQLNPASASFGRIAGFRGISNAPRNLQLGARITF